MKNQKLEELLIEEATLLIHLLNLTQDLGWHDIRVSIRDLRIREVQGPTSIGLVVAQVITQDGEQHLMPLHFVCTYDEALGLPPLCRVAAIT